MVNFFRKLERRNGMFNSLFIKLFIKKNNQVLFGNSLKVLKWLNSNLLCNQVN